MRAFASFLAASLVLASPAAAAPRRVASLNLCTDELVLLLAGPDQIVSVTHLSQDPAETPLWRLGRRYRRNDGSLMSAASARPDLIVTMGGGARDRLRIAERLGIAAVDLPFAMTLADVESNIRRVAVALGRPGAGEALIEQMSALRRSAPRRRIETIWLGGGGRTVSPEGLEGQWMALAGLAQRPLRGDRVSLETLIAAPPRILLRSDYRQGQYSGQQRWLNHPVARRARGSRTILTDGRRWTCAGALMIDEIARLRREVTP
jgi:iron complex transport system substrate-binding protein